MHSEKEVNPLPEQESRRRTILLVEVARFRTTMRMAVASQLQDRRKSRSRQSRNVRSSQDIKREPNIKIEHDSDTTATPNIKIDEYPITDAAKSNRWKRCT
jgi:hypothetical protein